ncbi:MAG TPA: hypothetical protein VGG89_16940 [Candidatus Baltobacteraceae bacterium]|jgi:hypothetical protein
MKLLPAFAVLAFAVSTGTAAAQYADDRYTVLHVSPSGTDSRIASGEPEHIVIYDRSAKPGNVLLFMPGTGGEPQLTRFLADAVDHGYRVVNLSYVDTPAVAQICYGQALRGDPDCAQQFRERRAYGDGSAPIQDQPQDAIVNRFTKLLQYLVTNDPQGNWGQYLQNGEVVWSRVAVAGQSQGGGMAEFIAQRQAVARVIVFSGGWDRSSPREIAHWYSGKSLTPADRWFGTFNVAEPMAHVIEASYAALGIPAAQQFALDKPTLGGVPAHADGISNPAYRDVWDRMLGSGN